MMTGHSQYDACAATDSDFCPERAHRDLDSIFNNWRFLAALAWQGYVTQGRGAIVVSVAGENAQIEYSCATRPRCHSRVAEYDPCTQIVVCVHHAEGESVYMLSGHPSPPECFQRASAWLMQATMH